MDMETDSEDEEDGQISKFEEEEEKDRKRFGKSEAEEEPIGLEDLSKCRLTRDLLVKYSMAPWFEEYVKGMSSFYNIVHWLIRVKGAWVRYLIGQESNEAIYRICEITSACVLRYFLFASVEVLVGIGPDPVKPYKIDDKSINQLIELRHGKSMRLFTMDKVSNSAFLPVGAQLSSLEYRFSEFNAERVRKSAEGVPDGRGKASNKGSNRNKIRSTYKTGIATHDRS